MKMRKDTETGLDTGEKLETERGADISAPTPRPLRAVLSGGPPEMGFYGRTWQRGQSQPVTSEEWTAMQTRGATQLGFNLIEEN